MVESTQIVMDFKGLLEQLSTGKLTSKTMAAWSEEKYWFLMEGEGKDYKNSEANFLRNILYDVVIQWECLLGNLYEECGVGGVDSAKFPEEWLSEWLSRIKLFLESIEYDH